MLSALLVLSAAGIFLNQTLSWTLIDPREPAGLWHLLFLALLLGALAVTAVRFASKQSSLWDELALLAVLVSGVNFMVQLSGGLHSPWQALYVILAGFAAAAYPPRIVIPLLSLIFTFEISNWAIHRVGSFGDLVRLVALVLIGVAGLSFFERTRRRKTERVEDELHRLNLGLQELEELEHGEGTSALSEEGKRMGRVEYARALDRRLADLLELVRFATDAHAAFLLRAEPGDSAYVVRLVAGPVADNTGKRVPVAGGILAEVLREDRMLSVTETTRALPPLAWYRPKSGTGWQPELHSMLAIPFRDRGGSQWIFLLDHTEPNHFDARRQELARAFAEQMVQWLASTRHLADLDILSNEFRSLYQASSVLSQGLRVEETVEEILSFCAKVSPFDTCAICLVEEGDESFSIPVAKGYPGKIRGSKVPLSSPTWAGWILRVREEPLTVRFPRRTGMPVLYPGERTPAGASFLGVPLLAENRVCGALLLTRVGKPFSSNEVRVLRILCNQSAIAIENARAHARLEQLAATDGLTGLFNRRYFQQALEREISRTDRGSGSLALLLLDIDHFKLLNDTYGHALGDLVLKKVAEVLQGTLRKGDVLARYGGEEFVILLPEGTYQGAAEFAQRIWSAVGAAPLHPEGGDNYVTVSVGWALLPEDAESAEKLVEFADRALYFAKETGRNKVAGYHLLRAEVES
jgi:diguanylate cyclase (GGDEF)-like protein